MPKELIEGLKEFIRTLLIGVIPAIISSLSEQTIDWKILGIATAIAGLRALDKWLHEKDIQPFERIGVDHAGLVPV